MNNLELSEIDNNQFPLIKILNKLPNKESLFETVIVAINDHLVELFLNKKITYLELINNLSEFLSKKNFININLWNPKNC